MKLRRSQKIGIAGIGVLLINILLQTAIFPSILKSKIKKKVALKNGWPMRTVWSKLPFPMELHWYVFNVTNPAEIEKGGKPKLREVGPFVYDLWQERINQVDHEEDDTVAYTLKSIHYFNPSKSNGLDDNDELVMPHLLMLGIPNGLMRDRPFLMPIASRAIDSVLDNPKSMFVQSKVKTLLFDGFPIDCRGMEDFHGKVLCNEMRDNYESFFLVKSGESTYRSALWGSFNATTRMGKRLRIHRGIRNIEEVGILTETEHKKNFSAWNTDYCDELHGTDYSIFPPFHNTKKKDNFFATFALLCRSFEYTYDSVVEYKGLKLLRYTAVIGVDGRNNPRDECFCVDANDCPPKGLFDLYKCLAIPLLVSSPHFYQADPQLVRSVDGLKPNKDKHMMIIDVDPLTGFAVRINMRMQVSLNIMPLKKYRLMQSFPEVVLPFAWFDQITVLPYSFVQDIKACHRILTISSVFNYLLIIIGLAMCAYAAYHQYKLRREKQLNTITRLTPESIIKHSGDNNRMPTRSASTSADTNEAS